MRLPPPGLLKLDRDRLLRDVAEQLARRHPASGISPDPTDPGWVLLEQAAWMVELLSEQLDQYPFAVLRQLLHLMGGHLLPARPALGVVVAGVSREGVLAIDPAEPSPWRLFTPQGERREAVEFVPAEPRLTLWRGAVDELVELRDGELWRAGRGDGADALVGWRRDPTRSEAFDREQVRYVLMSSNPSALAAALRDAVRRVEERRIGWLRLSVDSATAERVVLVAEIDPAGAFSVSAPGGVWTGGDLLGDWGNLDESSWTPPVHIASLPMIPPRIRGSRPLPTPEEGRILLPDLPPDLATAHLLTRAASPVPAGAVDAIWRTVANQDARLGALRPGVQRVLRGGAAAWLGPAMETGLWATLASGSGRSVASVRLVAGKEPLAEARVGLVFCGIDPLGAPPAEFFALDEAGRPVPSPLPARLAWVLPAAAASGQSGLSTVAAWDVAVPPGSKGLLLTTPLRPEAALLNPMLVVNAPVVRDGRRWTVNRHVPETLSLLFEDVLSPDVRQQLAQQPLAPVTAALLAALPLARFSVDNAERIADLAGLACDPTEGTLTLNAPDSDGQLRPLRPGSRIRLDWYRRTDGAAGNVPAGAISLVEQEPSLRPFLLRVSNPLATLFGADREGAEAAVDRLSVPASGLPVLPADFERLARQALGSRGQRWLVRCWSYAERTLLSAALWPPEPGRSELGRSIDAETRALKVALETAGPEVLLLAVGDPNGRLSDEDLAWARLVLTQQLRLLAQRLPVIRDALVARLWPLSLVVEVGAAPPPLPSFHPDSWAGTLVDEVGRQAAPPRAELLLNGAVVRLGERLP